MTTENFCFYLQNRLIQTSQTGGQWYTDTSPFSIPCFRISKASLVIQTLLFFQINNPKTFLELVGPGNEAGLTANANSLVSVQPSQVNKSKLGRFGKKNYSLSN